MPMRELGDEVIVDYYLTDAAGEPVDATVDAVLVSSETGTQTDLAPAVVSLGNWRVAVTPSRTGEWRIVWTASGAVTDSETVYLLIVDPAEDASPLLAAPGWAPDIADVAVHIPTRTRAVGTDNSYLGTFTADTTPTGVEVDRLIRHACAWVMGRTGSPVMPIAAGQAAVAAALLAAFWAEIGYPERDADVAVYDRLRTDFEASLAVAIDVNRGAGGGEGEGAGPGVGDLTTHSFPAPVSYGDLRYL